MEHLVRINLLDGSSETIHSKSSTTITPSFDSNDRSPRFHPSGNQVDGGMTSQKYLQYLSSEIPSLSDTIVKTCKHCSHSFHSLFAEDHPGNLYCSKGLSNSFLSCANPSSFTTKTSSSTQCFRGYVNSSHPCSHLFLNSTRLPRMSHMVQIEFDLRPARDCHQPLIVSQPKKIC
jgi:hypothetical protein